MKLIGTGNLYMLATSGSDDLVSAVLSLHAELLAADWDSAEQIVQAYPLARFKHDYTQISLPDGYCVVLRVSCSARVVLIEFAGQQHDWKTEMKRRKQP